MSEQSLLSHFQPLLKILPLMIFLEQYRIAPFPHFAVVSAGLNVSDTIVTRLTPLCVATKIFLISFYKSFKDQVSIIPALVAGVPSPFLSISTPFSSTSFPVISIAFKSVSSVKYFGGWGNFSLTSLFSNAQNIANTYIGQYSIFTLF